MLQPAFSPLFPILYFMLSLLLSSSANSNLYTLCSQLSFTSATPYKSNVNSLFATLIDLASVYKFNEFVTSPPSDVVFGLFQCRGDLSSSSCKDCVANSVSQLETACPMSRGGEIMLEGCFVKYGETSFFGMLDKTAMYRNCGPSVGYNSDVLNRIDYVLAQLVVENGQYFRGGDFESIHGVAQCVQDLSLRDCQDCLLEARRHLKSECETSRSGDMFLGKCYIRYDEQGKLDTPETNVKTTSNRRNGKWSKKKIIWTIVSVVATLCGATLAIKCCNKKVFNNVHVNNPNRINIYMSGDEDQAETVGERREKHLKRTQSTVTYRANNRTLRKTTSA